MATAVKKGAKPKVKPRPKKKIVAKPLKRKTVPKEETSLQLPDNVIVDLAAYDWGGEKLTDNQKLFVVWFTTPGQDCYHRAMRAARKAGYSPVTANADAYKMRRDPRIAKLIRQFEENIGMVDIVDAAKRWTHEKITRGDYDIADFYETAEELDLKTGKTKIELKLKDINELTPEQRLCIDGVDVKGMQGIMIYALPDREKIRDSLIALVRKQEMDGEKVDGEEETMEIIMERLTVRKTIRREKEEISRIAGLIRQPKGEPITEL